MSSTEGRLTPRNCYLEKGGEEWGGAERGTSLTSGAEEEEAEEEEEEEGGAKGERGAARSAGGSPSQGGSSTQNGSVAGKSEPSVCQRAVIGAARGQKYITAEPKDPGK